MCRYPTGEPGPRCNKYIHQNITKKEKELILEYHNKIRNNVSLGLTPCKSGLLPQAALMMQFFWDDELQTIAQRWADQCVAMKSEQHDICRRTKTFEVGQNVATFANYPFSELDYESAISEWFKEVNGYRAEWLAKYTGNPDESNIIDEFTQFIWGNTRYVGCASATFLDVVGSNAWWMTRVICNYAPAGNVIGKHVYEAGLPCSKCPPGFSCSSIYSGLCTPYVGRVDGNTISETTTSEKSQDTQPVSFQPLLQTDWVYWGEFDAMLLKHGNINTPLCLCRMGGGDDVGAGKAWMPHTVITITALTLLNVM